jgi:hypothetical protein
MRRERAADAEGLRRRAIDLAHRRLPERLHVVTDTTVFTEIERDEVVELEGRHFLIDGTLTEGRFGIDDQPKFWVRSVTDIEARVPRILKCVFLEEFTMRVGPIRIPCWRSPGKESEVLEFVRGDPRFMQGVTLRDDQGNLVRVLDRIHGPSLYRWLHAMEYSHERYFATVLPDLLDRFRDAVDGIRLLHDAGFCHGDIRADHLLLDRESGVLRWIDFDLVQSFSDYDLWSLGNVLAWCVGMGEHTLQSVRCDDRFPARVRSSLERGDGSVFFNHRVMNLRKLFPYVPPDLNRVLVRFSLADGEGYGTAAELLEDLDRARRVLPGRD